MLQELISNAKNEITKEIEDYDNLTKQQEELNKTYKALVEKIDSYPEFNFF